jgi:polyribonucleotide nucleotidyltransferase
METTINFNNVKYLVKSEVLLTKGQTTIVINYDNKTLWISIVLTPLENKFFSYKQLNFNYNNYIFTRNAEKKSKDDRDILLSRAIDRSIRPYIPDHFPYNINIESWNLSANDDNVFIPLIIGASCGLLNLGMIDHGIMPLIQENINLITTVYDHKIANMELGSKEISINDLIDILDEKIQVYNEYNQQLTKVFNFNNYNKQVNNYPLIDIFNIQNILNTIKDFQGNSHRFHSQMEEIINIIIKRMNDRFYHQFIHGNWDKNIDQWIMDQLNSSNIVDIKFFTEHIFLEVKKNLFCQNLIKNKIRQDGRKFQESREIKLEPCTLNNFHNSVSLVKGKTRVLIGGYFLPQDKNYENKIHIKYIFNNFINPKRNSNRREIGHGHLIEKSMAKAVEDYNWKAFFNCYITNSDGSSSMLSVIACGLMLQKFQWPLKKISGVSIGLIENNNKPNFLVDIAENEDFYCSMDMKITSTKDGIIGVQLDVKNQGVSLDLLKKSLELGQKINNKIITNLYKQSLDEITSGYYNNPTNNVITSKNFIGK